MTAATDVDLTVIEHLDFEPVCEVTFNHGERGCKLPAVWVMFYRAHCGGRVRAMLLCWDDYRHFGTGGASYCMKCGVTIEGTQDIIRFERLKP